MARGIDGQLLWPQEYITGFFKRPETGFPAAKAVASIDTDLGEFGKEVKRAYPKAHRKKMSADGKRTYMYTGLRLR